MPDRTPNLVFVFADQMRAQACGFMGNQQVRTPNMDRMAERGVVFENAVSSCPVCTPYRASLLTGRYPLACNTAMNDVRLPADELSIAEVLADAGHATGYIGKWHLDGQYRGGFIPPGPRRQGFDFWAANECTHHYMNTFYYRDAPEPMYLDGYSADGFTDIARDFISNHADEPFALFLSWAPPHNPYKEMPEGYDIYDPDDIELRPNTGEDAREDIAGYYGHITALDRNLGRLVDHLEQLQLADDTIIVFTSDHGDMLGAHGLGRKQKPWDEAIMVPWVMQWPGALPAGIRTDTLLNAPDVMPTLLSLMGMDIPETVQGQDLSHAARNAGGPERDSTYIANPMPFTGDQHDGEPWRGLRTKTHTYVEDEDGPWLLFDNETDPYQQTNLIDDPGTSELRRHLRAQLVDWMEEIGDDGASKAELVERFGYEINDRGVVPYYNDIGLHDPDNEA